MTVERTSKVFEVEISRSPDGSTVIGVTGNVDHGAAPVLWEALDLVAERGQQIVVDLRGAEFIDPAGLSVLMKAAARARDSHGDLRVRNPPPSARSILQIISARGGLSIEDEAGDLQGIGLGVTSDESNITLTIRPAPDCDVRKPPHGDRRSSVISPSSHKHSRGSRVAR